FDRLFDEVVRDGRLDLRFRHEIDGILRSSIKLGVPFLAPETFDLRDRQPLNAGLAQCLTDVFELERLDDCRDPLHLLLLPTEPGSDVRPVTLRSKDAGPCAVFVPRLRLL